MGLKQILDIIKDMGLGNIAVVVLILVSLVQISPLKIDPWSKLFKWIGGIINEDSMKEIKDIKEDLKVVHNELDRIDEEDKKREANATRNRILKFDDELRRKVDHSEEFYNQILEDITAYTDYCEEHDTYPNCRADGAINNIRATYTDCKKNNKFI